MSLNNDAWGHNKPLSSPPGSMERILDLMKKSCGQPLFQIVDGGDQVEARMKAPTAITIAQREDVEALEGTYDVLDANAHGRMQAIVGALLVIERVAGRGLER